MTKAVIGRLVLSAVAVFTAVTPYLADWNETHIYNPRWPPHAKFHNGQTMAFATMLGILALGYTWWRKDDGNDRERILAAGVFAGLYWATQGLAHFYPGVAYRDPEFVTTGGLQPFLGMTPQGIIDIIIMAITAAGVWLAGGFARKPTL